MSSLSIPKNIGVVPSIISSSCKEHVAWVKKVFQAEQLGIHMSHDAKRVMHCMLAINNGLLYMSDYGEELGQKSSDYSGNPTGFILHLDTPDADAVFSQATNNGAEVIVKLEKQPCENFYGCFKDPFGFVWGILKVEEGKGTPGVVPCLKNSKENCEDHVQWLVSVFGAEVINKCSSEKDGSTCHCILGISGGHVHVTGETLPALEFLSATSTTNRLQCHLDMEDPFVLWKKALENGSKVKIELKEQFWGGVYGSLVDTMGFEWSFSKKRAEDSKHPLMGVYAYIISSDCENHIEWIQRVFEGGMKAQFRHVDTKKVMHCDIAFSGGRVMICDASCGPSQEKESEASGGESGTTSKVFVQVICRDPDEIWKRAMVEGASEVVELKRQYWGGYFGSFRDPYGVQWCVMKSFEPSGSTC